MNYHVVYKGVKQEFLYPDSSVLTDALKIPFTSLEEEG